MREESGTGHKMEQLANSLCVLIGLIALLRIGLFERSWQRLVFALACAFFAWGIYPLAISQNKSFLPALLGDVSRLYNIAMLLILDGLLFFGVAFEQLKYFFGAPDQRPRWQITTMRWMAYLPGLFVGPVIFYGEVLAFLNIDRLPFEYVTLLYAFVLLLGLWGCSGMIRYFLPERDLRMELCCFLLVLQLVLAVVLTAAPLAHHPAVATGEGGLAELWKPFCGWLALFAIGAAWGYLLFQRRNNRKIKR